MSCTTDPRPSTSKLCGTFPTVVTADTGCYFSAAIQPSCEAPVATVDGEAEIVYVDGEPQSLEIE